MTAIYRITQGVRALLAVTQEIDYTLPETYLSDELLIAFKQLRVSEQLHSIRVLRSVLAQQPDTPHDLAIAALMHDCGKARYPLGVWGKTIAVLTEKLAPPLFNWLANLDPNRQRWACPFIIRQHHPYWGADMLREARANECTVWLVEHHQEVVAMWMDHPYAPLLWRLQQADDTN